MTLSKITNHLTAIGCSFPDIGLLQPADPFLDTIGEDLRRRIFITSVNSGRVLCLRPEFTVPVCLSHIENGNGQAQYAYAGTVFRQRNNEAAEFTQAGFESFGHADHGKADIDCIKTAIGALEATGQTGLGLVLGDQAVFASLLDALEIQKGWQKKLIRSFGDDTWLTANLDAMSVEKDEKFANLPEDIQTCLKAGDIVRVTEWLTEQMIADGLPLSGGRTASSIAERMMEKTELAATRLEKDKRDILEAFLKIDVPLADAPERIREFEKMHALNLAGAADKLASLLNGLSGATNEMRYRANFGRRIDYYTGLVFEVYRKGFEKPVVGGGRYDRLLTLLGAAQEIPAVGFAIWVDRLEGEVS